MKKNQFQKTIVVDFDGTISSKDTKSALKIPEPRKNAVRVMNRWISEGYMVIINTLRDNGVWREAALEYLHKYNIQYTYFNENAAERIEAFGDARKISGDIIIDDRNLGGIPSDFEDIDKFVKSQIGYPYKEVGGELVEDKPKLLISATQFAVTEFAETGLAARFSPEFRRDVAKCPLLNAIYNNILSGNMNEYQTMEYLVKELKDAHNQMQQMMFEFAKLTPKGKQS